MELLEKPGVHFLLANTHLFFHPKADFTRLIQAVVCAKYLEKLRFDLLSHSGVKEANILFGGDFNSDPPSHAFTYLFTQSIPFDNLSQGLPHYIVAHLFGNLNKIIMMFINRGKNTSARLR